PYASARERIREPIHVIRWLVAKSLPYAVRWRRVSRRACLRTADGPCGATPLERWRRLHSGGAFSHGAAEHTSNTRISGYMRKGRNRMRLLLYLGKGGVGKT